MEELQTKDIVDLWKKQGNNIESIFYENHTIGKYQCKKCNLIFFDPLICGDDNFYSELGKSEWYYLHDDKTEYTYANNFIKDNDFILDIGSGRGAFFKYITSKNISYTGLDLSSQAVSDAQKENINVLQKTLECFIKDTNQKFDVIVIFQVLEHLDNINGFIKLAIQCLKESGYIIIAVPNNAAFIKFAQNHLLNIPPHHVLHWNEKSLRFLAGINSLEVVDIFFEKVTNVHGHYFFSTVIAALIRKLLFIKEKSISRAALNRVINKFSAIIASIMIFFKIKIYDKFNGQTMIIVLKRK